MPIVTKTLVVLRLFAEITQKTSTQEPPTESTRLAENQAADGQKCTRALRLSRVFFDKASCLFPSTLPFPTSALAFLPGSAPSFTLLFRLDILDRVDDHSSVLDDRRPDQIPMRGIRVVFAAERVPQAPLKSLPVLEREGDALRRVLGSLETKGPPIQRMLESMPASFWGHPHKTIMPSQTWKRRRSR